MIVFLDGYSLDGSSLSEIEELGRLETHKNTTQNQVVERCKNAQIIITNKVRIMKPEIEKLPMLKLICVAATGTNNVDIEFAESRGIQVKNVPAYSTQSVAEATLALTLALLRQIPFYNNFVHSGQYAQGNRCFNLDRQINEIAGKKWGIIGMGAIGQRVAEIAEAFGAEICYYSTSGKNNNQKYTQKTLEELLKTCDIVSIHCPLNPNTDGLIGSSEIAMMKPNAIILNLGRGGIIDETALAKALNQNKIAGAGLDVFKNEPIEPNNPLLKLNDPLKLITAPHCGWSSIEARKKLVHTIAQNIKQWQAQNTDKH